MSEGPRHASLFSAMTIGWHSAQSPLLVAGVFSPSKAKSCTMQRASPDCLSPDDSVRFARTRSAKCICIYSLCYKRTFSQELYSVDYFC